MHAFILLAKNPIGSLAYCLISLCLASMWAYKRIWVWSSLFLAAMVAAYYGDIIELKAIFPITLLFLCHLWIKTGISGFVKLFAVMIASVISVGLLTHFISGFHNVCLYKGWKSSSDAAPINIYLNFDKAIVPIFIMGLYLPLIQTIQGLKRAILLSIPAFIALSTTLLGLSYYFAIIKLEIKFPLVTPIWILNQIFFVVIAEEVFWRGFIQREISKSLNNRFSGVLAILVTSLLFTLCHIFFILDPTFLFLVFLAGIFYGAIYEMTKTIECSVFVHLATNATHFFFFTYPMLQT